MTTAESFIPEGLAYKDGDQLMAKLRRFIGQTASIHAVADFDRTLTQRRGGVMKTSPAGISCESICLQKLKPNISVYFKLLAPKN